MPRPSHYLPSSTDRRKGSQLDALDSDDDSDALPSKTPGAMRTISDVKAKALADIRDRNAQSRPDQYMTTRPVVSLGDSDSDVDGDNNANAGVEDEVSSAETLSVQERQARWDALSSSDDDEAAPPVRAVSIVKSGGVTESFETTMPPAAYVGRMIGALGNAEPSPHTPPSWTHENEGNSTYKDAMKLLAPGRGERNAAMRRPAHETSKNHMNIYDNTEWENTAAASSSAAAAAAPPPPAPPAPERQPVFRLPAQNRAAGFNAFRQNLREGLVATNQPTTDLNNYARDLWKMLSGERITFWNNTAAEAHRMKLANIDRHVGAPQQRQSDPRRRVKVLEQPPAPAPAKPPSRKRRASASAAPASASASAPPAAKKSKGATRNPPPAPPAPPPPDFDDSPQHGHVRPFTKHGYSITVNHPSGRGIEAMHRHTLTFLRQMRGRGGFSIELCPKANHLHLQGAVQFPGGKDYGPNSTQVRKKLKSYLDIKNGMNYKVIIQEFGKTGTGKGASHNMETMMGYIQKDEGAQHYKLETIGYTSTQLLQCKEKHQSIRVSHETDKDMLTKSSLVKHMFQFRYRHIEPLEPNALRTLTWMLQSEKYMPSGDWIIGRSGRRVDRIGLEVMWKVAADPKSATMDDANKIFIEFERDMSPLNASVHAWNQDGCEEFKDYEDARIEVKRLREMRARRERDEAEFLEGLDNPDNDAGDEHDGNDDDLSPPSELEGRAAGDFGSGAAAAADAGFFSHDYA